MRMLIAALTVALVATGSTAAEFPTATPESKGLDSAALADLVDAVRASGQPLHSLIVAREDTVILDARFYPYDGSLHDMASVTKSVTTSLVGIAAAEGKLSLNDTMVSFFKGRPIANVDDWKAKITVGDLTRNLSGLACIGAPEEVTLDQMEHSADFVTFALDLPSAYEPGKHFEYCSPGMHLLSAILQQATGKTEAAYAQEKLFGPLGITDAIWDADPQGVTRGWGDLHLTPPDMLKLGELWLHEGRWEGRQLIPADWLKAATTQAVKSGNHEDYGAGFWIAPSDEPIGYFMAQGRGGQRVLVVPSLQLVAVTTAGGFDPGEVMNAIGSAVRNPSGAIPANPAGEAKLAAAIAAAEAGPAAGPVAELPAMAKAVSGLTYRFADNPFGIVSLSVDFPGGNEGSMTVVTNTDATPRPVGLDGRYRFSAGADGVTLGDRGRWTDESTLEIDHNTIGDIRAYTITGHFAGNNVDLTIQQRDEAGTVKMTGTAE